MDRVAEMRQQASATAEQRLIEPTILTHATATDTSLITSTATWGSLSLLNSSAIQKKATQIVLTILQRPKTVR